MYYVFLGMNTLVLLIVALLLPETKQLDLESMNRLFGESKPCSRESNIDTTDLLLRS
jgi:hypothetical protein